ncbi:MAG: metallophosphoesterase [Alphaproteobacteria bacterium]|nr:metallophosphoesterase [Alphaproteobacteria bacterium]
MHLQIAIVVSLLGLCITMPVFVRYFACSGFPFWIKLLGFLICVVIAVSPVIISRNFADAYGRHFAWIESVVYFIYVFAVIVFSLTFLRDIIWVILSWFKWAPSPFKPAIFNPINWATLVIAFLCALWSLYEGTKVPAYRHITLTDTKIQTSRTIVVLSDLHISRTINPDKIKGIVAQTNALQPDLILLAGDIVDDHPDTIRNITAILSDLNAKQGVYFVSGNHEFYIGYRTAMDMLSDLGLKSIENRKVQISPDLVLAGVADIRTTTRLGLPDKTREVLSDAPKSSYTILISHSPTPLNLPFDLQVSGHTHGGQIFPFHILSWLGNHHLSSGFYPKERIYVSRGAGQWGPQMRFLAPSEITVIHLQSQKAF